MKRRDFFKMSAPLTASPLLLNGFQVSPFASSNMISSLDCEGVADRTLVVIRMSGGNDGINNIIPLEQHDFYMSKRPNIGIPLADLTNLDTGLAAADQIGLHPSLQNFKTVYDSSDYNLNVIQAVSYNQPNYSHFKATDLMLTGGDGSPANFDIGTGWMGRYLNHVFPGSAGFPTSTMPDPLGIQVGDTAPSLGFHTLQQFETAINLGWNDPSGYYDLVNQIGGDYISNVPNSQYGSELQYIMDVEQSVASYAQRITDVFNAGNNNGSYPSTGLGYQLKTVARLISGGSKTKIFLVNIGGFDTHNEQAVGSPTQGRHADDLQELAEAVKAFMDDLNAQSYGTGTLLDKTLTMTFSEFGRRPWENDSQGTDHGDLFPMYLFGKSVNNGVTGTNIDISNVDDPSDPNPYLDEPAQHDYRQVYTTVLQDWLGATDDAIDTAYFSDFLDDKLPLIADGYNVDVDCRINNFLPVDILFFNAEPTSDKTVLLTWDTAFEKDNSYFEIQRSGNGTDWEKLNRVLSKGDSAFVQKYQDLDSNPYPGTSYYRLKQVDLDGATKFTEVKTVFFESQNVKHLRVYPVPARFDIKVVMTIGKPANDVSIEIYDMAGKQKYSEKLNLQTGFNKHSIEVSNLPEGNYILRATSLSLDFSETRKIVVKRY